MCLPKSASGLGLKNMRAMNSALLAKNAGPMLQNDDALWTHVFGNKHLARGNNYLFKHVNWQGASST